MAWHVLRVVKETEVSKAAQVRAKSLSILYAAID
jgi:hypothetical protein